MGTTTAFSRSKISFLLLASLILFACQKTLNDENQRLPNELAAYKENGHLKQTQTHSSEVVISWLNMQLDMLRVPLPAGVTTQNANRAFGYCGVAAYEAVVPGMPAYQSLHGQLVDLPEMPTTEPGKAYHWAASANAALALINRGLFPGASQTNKDAMNALEASLQTKYASETDAATLQRSVAFGREVAARVLAWASADGSANTNPPYVAPVGFGKWVPTAPTPAVTPYASQWRKMVPGVADGTALTPPPDYSITPGSSFWNMVKDVYDRSFTTTTDQKNAAIYNRDAPGYPGGGHFISIYSQALSKAQPKLDVAALGYAKAGIACYDGSVICFTNKYNFLIIRPVTYIKTVMGHTTWEPLIPTPNHPEFPSGHATINSATLTMFTNIFGENFQLTLHTYDYLNLPPRSYNSFNEMSVEMSNSRVWGGIHYQATQDKSMVQGRRVAQNILGTIKFLKD